MPNFAYTNQTNFKPFSYQEMLAPVLAYTQAQRELEDQYSELSTKADVWQRLANERKDTRAYNIYKDFSDEIEKKADDLARSGLTSSSRNDLLKLKARYSKDIAPMEYLFNRREKIAEEQRKLKANDSSIMFDNDFSTVSIDQLLDNPSLSYTPVSGNDLYNKGKEAALSASARKIRVSSDLQGQYWRIKQGYGADAANKFLLSHDSIPELKEAVNRIVSQSGVTQNNLGRAINYALSGIMAGLSYNESYQANRGYIDPAERERLSLAREQFNWEKSKWEEQQLGTRLPNNDRIKDIGGGRVRVVHPNGGVEILAAPKSGGAKASSGSGQTKKTKKFISLDYTGDSFGTPGPTDVFSKRDSKPISFDELSPSARRKLTEDLDKYNLGIEDVEILKDQDYFSRNHYRVLPKSKKRPSNNTSSEYVESDFGQV